MVRNGDPAIGLTHIILGGMICISYNTMLDMKREFVRHVIAESEQIVALDTNVARELCYMQPSWVGTFQQMR